MIQINEYPRKILQNQVKLSYTFHVVRVIWSRKNYVRVWMYVWIVTRVYIVDSESVRQILHTQACACFIVAAAAAVVVCYMSFFHSSIQSVCEYCIAARARHSSVYITYEIYSHYHMGTGIPSVAAIRYAKKKHTARERECFRTIRIRWCECFMCWLEFQWFLYCITKLKKVSVCECVYSSRSSSLF